MLMSIQRVPSFSSSVVWANKLYQRLVGCIVFRDSLHLVLGVNNFPAINNACQLQYNTTSNSKHLRCKTARCLFGLYLVTDIANNRALVFWRFRSLVIETDT